MLQMPPGQPSAEYTRYVEDVLRPRWEGILHSGARNAPSFADYLAEQENIACTDDPLQPVVEPKPAPPQPVSLPQASVAEQEPRAKVTFRAQGWMS